MLLKYPCRYIKNHNPKQTSPPPARIYPLEKSNGPLNSLKLPKIKAYSIISNTWSSPMQWLVI